MNEHLTERVVPDMGTPRYSSSEANSVARLEQEWRHWRTSRTLKDVASRVVGVDEPELLADLQRLLEPDNRPVFLLAVGISPTESRRRILEQALKFVSQKVEADDDFLRALALLVRVRPGEELSWGELLACLALFHLDSMLDSALRCNREPDGMALYEEFTDSIINKLYAKLLPGPAPEWVQRLFLPAVLGSKGNGLARDVMGVRYGSDAASEILERVLGQRTETPDARIAYLAHCLKYPVDVSRYDGLYESLVALGAAADRVIAETWSRQAPNQFNPLPAHLEIKAAKSDGFTTGLASALWISPERPTWDLVFARLDSNQVIGLLERFLRWSEREGGFSAGSPMRTARVIALVGRLVFLAAASAGDFEGRLKAMGDWRAAYADASKKCAELGLIQLGEYSTGLRVLEP
ncbi:MAG: hypothetical protein HYY18_16070 [Planctomycetes bacterium]|nr:hypothetical protein [Planctomycetota bacterium]